MGESAISKQLDAFIKMYMEDKKEHDLKQRELQAQIVELSISVERCVPSRSQQGSRE